MKFRVVIVLLFIAFLTSRHLRGQEKLLDCFHVCTIASYEHPNLSLLNDSCLKHYVSLEVLGLGEPYPGNGCRLVKMIEYLKTLKDDDIVMFVDAFDVLIVADKEVILDKFLKMNTPFVISAEKNCSPRRNDKDQFPPSPTQFRWINAGSYIGYVSYLKSWLNDLQPIAANKSDQMQMLNHYLKNPERYTLDFHCEIFFPTYWVPAEEIVIDPINKTLFNKATGTYPCVIHENGGKKERIGYYHSLLFHE